MIWMLVLGIIFLSLASIMNSRSVRLLRFPQEDLRAIRLRMEDLRRRIEALEQEGPEFPQ